MRWAAVTGCVALCVAAVTAGAANPAASTCPQSLANQLASTGSAVQLVTVTAPRSTSTQASLRLWRKSGACWYPAAGPWAAWVGEHGVSEHKQEGDRTTPAGAFGFLPTMYGIAPNPGVRYRYHRVICGDWWVEDSRSPFYNRFKHVRCDSKPPFRVTSEDMSRSPTAYRHLAVIAYNRYPIVPGRGSGIFLHASTGRPTLGCVSLPLPRLLVLLRWLRPESRPLIVIGTDARIRRF
jgi:L,D-peptidoglycan transpeptidase YkuD (ErfK/YbiS/YcfS/YnhG family)